MGFEENDTVVILSENSLEHALLALASVHRYSVFTNFACVFFGVGRLF
jgi:hypothetical protein